MLTGWKSSASPADIGPVRNHADRLAVVALHILSQAIGKIRLVGERRMLDAVSND
jgi:hypothetical protein